MHIEPYNWRLVLFDDKAQFNAYLKACGAPESAAVTDECGRTSWNVKTRLVMIGVFPGPDGAKVQSPAMPGTLAHELLHAILAIFDHISLPVDDRTSEAACYMLQHLFDPCFEALYRNYRWVKRTNRRKP